MRCEKRMRYYGFKVSGFGMSLSPWDLSHAHGRISSAKPLRDTKITQKAKYSKLLVSLNAQFYLPFRVLLHLICLIRFKWTVVHLPIWFGLFRPRQFDRLISHRTKRPDQNLPERWVSIRFQVNSGGACLWCENKTDHPQDIVIVDMWF